MNSSSHLVPESPQITVFNLVLGGGQYSLVNWGRHCTHANVWESMGKRYKKRIFYYKSRENPYQVLQVTCAVSEHAMKSLYRKNITRLPLVLRTRNNT